MNAEPAKLPKPWRKKLKPIAKTVVGILTSVLLIVNATVPDYSDEATLAVGILVGILGSLGIYQVKNEPAE